MTPSPAPRGLFPLLAGLWVLTPLLSGCPDGKPPVVGCTLPYLGDPTQPMQIELFYLPAQSTVPFGVAENLPAQDLAECGPIDLVFPPQGGRVLFVGARATNLAGCDASLTTALHYPSNNSLVGNPDVRSTAFSGIAGRPGWGATAPSGDSTNGYSQVANMSVCPNFEGKRDIQQQPWILEVRIKDKDGKMGQVLRRVFPRCVVGDALCECNCQAGWNMTKCMDVTIWPASPDAGACAL